MLSNPTKRSSLIVEVVMLIIIVFIFIAGVYLVHQYSQNLSKQHYNVANTTNTIIALKNLKVSVALAESGQRGYLLTDKDIYLKPYNESLSDLEQRILVVNNLEITIPFQAERIDNLISLIDQKREQMAKTIQLLKFDNPEMAQKLVLSGLGQELHEAIAEVFTEIEDAEYSLLASQFKELKAMEASNKGLYSVFFIIGFLSIVLMLTLLIKIRQKDHQYKDDLEQKASMLEELVEERTQELAVYSDQLVQSNRELEEFAFIASHDLQEPLRKVQAFSNRIKDMYANKLDEKGLDYIDRMSKAAARMSLLISDLLEFSRIKARGKPFEDFSLSRLVDEVLDDLEISAKEANVTVNIDKLPTLRGDYSQLSQLFANLLSNAIKFRDVNRAPVIDITYQRKDVQVEDCSIEFHQIKIQDNGIGFEQSYADKVFLPFQRLHSRDAYAGTGIGLSICRRIVERHGGQVDVQSVVGQGTIFDILLPVDMTTIEDVQD